MSAAVSSLLLPQHVCGIDAQGPLHGPSDRKRSRDPQRQRNRGQHQWILLASGCVIGMLLGVATSRVLSAIDRKSTRLNSSHLGISYAVFCLKKKPRVK